MTAQPETKINMLIEQLNSFQQKGGWDRNISRAFEAEAYRIRDIDIADGDMLLGIINGLNSNTREMQKRFTNALAYRSGDTTIIFNYGMSLYHGSLYSQAIQVLQGIAESDKDAAYITGLCCYALGLKNKAEYYFSYAEKYPDQKLLNNFSKPVCVEEAFKNLQTSFVRDHEIWQSLSTR